MIADAEGYFNSTDLAGFFLVVDPSMVTGANPLTSGGWAVTAPVPGPAPGASPDRTDGFYGD